MTTTKFHSSCTMMGLRTQASPAGALPDTYLTRVSNMVSNRLTSLPPNRICVDSNVWYI